MIPTAPINPWWPTAYPNLRNNIAPRIVEMVVIKTGRVPKLAVVLCGWVLGKVLATLKNNEGYKKI
jgi:hypothetical protein